MKKNELYEVEITDLNNLGNGVCRIEGKAVFVPRAVDGDRLLVKIIKDTADYAVARIEQILSPSPHRQESGCTVSGRCGGCVYRQITYSHECDLKRAYVKSAFRKAGVSVEVAETLSGKDAGYRNKVQYPVGEQLQIGFFAPRSHEIIPCSDCALQAEVFAPILSALQALLRRAKTQPYNEKDGSGLLRHVFLRSSASGEVMVTLITTDRPFPAAREIADALRKAHPEVISVVRNINNARNNVILGQKCITLSGADALTDTLCGLTFHLSPLSFYQVNHDMAESLYRKAAELAELRAGDRIADLFCGAGTIGLSIAAMYPDITLTGVEIIPEAVENAKENAKLNGIANATFVCGDANAPELSGCDVIFLDPPRKGCEAKLIEQIAALAPRKVVYISCNPDTLARDVARFIEQGYLPSTVYPVDLFPRTGHCETIVLLSQLKSRDSIKIDVDLTDTDLTSSEAKASYTQIRKYIWEKYQVKVSSLYISQVKRKLGLPVSESYNKPKSNAYRVPTCPEEKEQLICEALRHFKMIE